MTKNLERKLLLQQVEQTLDTYCSGCFLYHTHKKEFSRAYAHQFCLSSCTIGEQLRVIGEKLTIEK